MKRNIQLVFLGVFAMIWLSGCDLKRPFNFMGKVTPDLEEVEASDKETNQLEVVIPTYSFETLYNSNNKNRAFNIEKATKIIDGITLMPGDVFSFNKEVGPAGETEGYKEAMVFVNKKKKTGFGGGVCQVSSTLYNAALGAEMEIVERHPHSLEVAYIEEGKDAAVAYGSLDLRFKNIKSYPVRIEATSNAGEVQITIVKA